MRDFTHEEIKNLVDNGYLLPSKYSHNDFYEDKKENAFFSLVGSPVAIEKEYFIKEMKNFPTYILKEYTIEVTHHFRKSMQDIYVIPSGIQDMKSFNENNTQLIAKLKEYINLSEIYFHNNLNTKEKTQTQLTLLQLFRELYVIYLVDCDNSFSIISDNFLTLYQQGLEYRSIFKTFNSSAFKLLKKSEVDILSSVFNNVEDLILFENATLNTKKYFKKIYDIPIHVLPLWKQILIHKSWAGNYPKSPYFENIKENLGAYNYNATQKTIDLLELLSVYDFSLLKDTYLSILKNCNKPGLIEYIEEKLKHHNCISDNLPNLIIKQENSVIYNNTFHLNFDFFKHHVKNHVYAAQCLIGIVEKSFRDNEKDCSRLDCDYVKNTNIVIILIETLQQNKIEELSRKLIGYIDSVLCPEFLNEDTIKLLSKHPSNSYSRKEYENDSFVMDRYLQIKEKFILKEKLLHKLVSKNNTEKVKKI